MVMDGSTRERLTRAVGKNEAARRLHAGLQRVAWLARYRTGSGRCREARNGDPMIDRAAPQFAILGTQRGGTTSLYHYLAAHPCIVPAVRKELHFLDTHYGKGPGWYRAQFPPRLPAGTLTGEATPYYLFHPDAARRLRLHAPHAKLIVLLRDPVARAHSHYWHEVRRGRESMPFEAALEAEEDRLRGEAERLLVDPSYRSFNHQRFSYVARGRYADQLQSWFAHFPREQFFILQSEDLYRDPTATVRRVTDFLGLPPHALSEYKTYNVAANPPMSQEAREWLTAAFREPNRRLRDELGLEFTWIEP